MIRLWARIWSFFYVCLKFCTLCKNKIESLNYRYCRYPSHTWQWYIKLSLTIIPHWSENKLCQTVWLTFEAWSSKKVKEGLLGFGELTFFYLRKPLFENCYKSIIRKVQTFWASDVFMVTTVSMGYFLVSFSHTPVIKSIPWTLL